MRPHGLAQRLQFAAEIEHLVCEPGGRVALGGEIAGEASGQIDCAQGGGVRTARGRNRLAFGDVLAMEHLDLRKLLGGDGRAHGAAFPRTMSPNTVAKSLLDVDSVAVVHGCGLRGEGGSFNAAKPALG